MKIAIIGAGFTGLSAAYYLSKGGHSVDVFELDEKPGGLAIGFKPVNQRKKVPALRSKTTKWDWTLEKHYHHWFTNDKNVLDLASEIHHQVEVVRPKTSSFVHDKIFQLDSPTSLLKFPKLSLTDRIRMGVSLALLKYNPIWRPLEKYKAEPYLKKFMGKKGYDMIWKPLMDNKLGKYAKDVSLSWFWARIYKRTPSLAYPEGGFLEFALHLQKAAEKNGAKFFYETEVVNLTSNNNPQVTFKKVRGKQSLRSSASTVGLEKLVVSNYDTVIVTTPSFLFKKITPSLPKDYSEKLGKLVGIGAMNLVLRLKQPFFSDNTYWLNMCDLKSPILAIVEHTNFMDKKHYGNEHLVYLGNYMEITDPRFKMTEQQLLKLYDPWLKKINPNYKKYIIGSELFHAPFAQPIIFPNYSKQIPEFKTPLKNVYLANIEQVYPWDRGTNYAVELGKRITEIIVQ